MKLRRQLRPVLLLSLLRALLGFAVASPLLVVIAGTGVAAFPGADALLFEPGGTYLVEALRLSSRQLRPALEAAAWLGLGAVGLLLVGLCFLMVSLARERPPPLGAWARESFECVPSFVLLLGLTWLGQALALLLLLLAATLVLGAIPETSPRLRDGGWAVAIGLAVLVILALGVLQDLARAARVALGLDVRAALGRALQVARRYPRRVASGYGLRALGSLLAVLAAAWLVGVLQVERGGTLRLLGVLVVHQSAALVWTALRAGWLAEALGLSRLSSGPGPAPVDTPEDSAAPGDPRPDPGA